jgi:ABC-type Fe3+ transport system permease subunit
MRYLLFSPTVMIRQHMGRYLPLVAHVVPTLVIGYGLIIPRSCIAGWNELTIGFGVSVLGTCFAYMLGQRVGSTCRVGGRGRAAS